MPCACIGGAALVGTAMCGFFASTIIIVAIDVASIGHVGLGANLWGGMLYFGLMCAGAGVVLGFIPAVLVLTFSPARYAPWSALPVLVAGSLLGYFAVFPFTWMRPGDGANVYILPVATVLGPTIGGIIAARYLRKHA